MNDPNTVSLPLDVARKLFAVWDTWQNRVDCYDPGDMPGIASLLGVEGAWLMDDVTGAVEPHEAQLRQLLGLADDREVSG